MRRPVEQSRTSSIPPSAHEDKGKILTPSTPNLSSSRVDSYGSNMYRLNSKFNFRLVNVSGRGLGTLTKVTKTHERRLSTIFFFFTTKLISYVRVSVLSFGCLPIFYLTERGTGQWIGGSRRGASVDHDSQRKKSRKIKVFLVSGRCRPTTDPKSEGRSKVPVVGPQSVDTLPPTLPHLLLRPEPLLRVSSETKIAVTKLKFFLT